MSGVVRAAVLQMNSGEDVEANLCTALQLIDAAAARGAELLVLPEKFHYLGGRQGVGAAKQDLDGPVLEAMAQAARAHGVYLVAGSVWEAVPGEDRTYNTSVLFGPDGRLLALYRKIHMFDVDVGGHSYRESDECRPGSEVVAVRLPGLPRTGVGDGLVLGLSICYDIRFPDLYTGLAELGARIVTVPAAFTLATGKDHWEVLLRARAIENQVFVVAANQTGRHEPGLESYGRSMIVDPWGIVLAQVGDGNGVAVADLDLGRLERVRRSLPALANRVPAAYAARRLVETT
ncbi:MAG: carbon-nitrogen hydrolase family protein [Thermoleophilia bacterium]